MRTGGPLLAALTALAPLAPVSGCNCGMPEGDYFGTVAEHPEPGHLRYCNAGEPQYLDPALSTSTSDLKPVYALWDGLTRHNLDGLPEPSIATRWDVSDDQRIFTFHLRSDARWSTGRPITAYDFRYHIVRILHPLTASSNTDAHWKLKNGKDFTANTVRMVLRDSGPFKAGDVVVMTDAEDDKQTAARTELLSHTNRFRADIDLELRDLPGAPETLGPEPYYTVDAGDEVTLIERASGPGGELWAYVHRASGDGVYGWVPAKLLTRQEHMEETVPMHAVSRTRVPGLQISREEFAAIKKAEEDTEHPVKPVTAEVKITDMMMLPEVLGLQAPDEHTLVLETENPTPFIIDLSPQRAYRATPREAVSRWPQKWSRPEHIITSGPFHLTEWRIRDFMEMVKSPTYWDAAHVRLDKLTIYAIDDQAATANYYYYGGCDATHSNDVPASYLPILTGERRGGRQFSDFYTAPFLGIYFYLINTEKVSNRH
ncbi:MAG TPA: ABC transporter substrate-binding protein, partial [Kofleriaceae bacterium]|nr:ABC transporter substrate-binding protein [Kofleriaceae bacterium]